MKSKSELSERQRYWLDHIESCAALGQTTKAYAESQGLSVSMVYSWRKKLAAMGMFPDRTKRRQSSSFERVQVVGGQPPSGEWRIALPNGVRIGFTGTVDGRLLSTVLEAASRL